MTAPRLKFSVSVIAGQSPASSDVDYLDSGLPFLQGKAEFGLEHPFPRYECAVATKVCAPADILVSVRAPVGKINVADQIYGLGRGLAAVRAEGIHPGFLRWVLEDSESLLRAESNGSTFEAITAWHIGEVPYVQLDRETQERIAAYLEEESAKVFSVVGQLDLLADLLRHRMRVTSTLSVFGLASGHRDRKTDSHSPLSGIPEHWDRTKFGYDFTESTERNGDDPPGPLLSISEYRGVEVNKRTEGQQASLDVSKYRVVRPGQLAANMMWLNHGGLGVSSLTGYISPDYKAFWISDRFEPRYVHHLFRSSRYIDYFAAIATGVRPNAQRVTKTVLDATPVPLPPLHEQIQIADRLDEATARVDAMLEKVAELKSLLLERRAALITDVVTGKKEIA